mmetsp:Transcript_30339/g.44306  ORF Transcript_30339/g.44306 Transcript_30339/m.44306 type:complete len:219 (-) Transcript_30339:875-1531(-)
MDGKDVLELRGCGCLWRRAAHAGCLPGAGRHIQRQLDATRCHFAGRSARLLNHVPHLRNSRRRLLQGAHYPVVSRGHRRDDSNDRLVADVWAAHCCKDPEWHFHRYARAVAAGARWGHALCSQPRQSVRLPKLHWHHWRHRGQHACHYSRGGDVLGDGRLAPSLPHLECLPGPNHSWLRVLSLRGARRDRQEKGAAAGRNVAHVLGGATAATGSGGMV